ncbi:methionine synthase [Skermania sp. ID1734]|uniref:methionine synthase n=1 Tax=Skermania sp. ID1734 TaxID=2597516 RepID=UPI0011815BED|nr:methionine synthase [Skermania sp. ID1734]TSE01007.1 methionine synthase [Skermania sp. ID1734]
MSFPAGVATGIGSWPGTDPREAAAVIVGELVELPHLAELPARGIGADMIGRTGALLVDLPFDTTTRGYRIAAHRGAVSKRATDLLNRDLDALEEAWETAGLVDAQRHIKVQAAGPWTLAAEVELANGHKVLTDRGAVREFAESLGEGLVRHVTEVRRRLGASVVLQLDEPLLASVLAGTISGVTARERIPAIPAPDALVLLDAVIAQADVPVVVHDCSSAPPWELFRRSRADAVSFDLNLIDSADLDPIGELLDADKNLILGIVPTRPLTPAPTWRDCAAPAVKLVDRLGFPRSALGGRVSVSPACGLAGASESWARKALALCNDVARALVEEPEKL